MPYSGSTLRSSLALEGQETPLISGMKKRLDKSGTRMYNENMARRIARNISMLPEDFELLDSMAKGFNMNRSQFIVWLMRITARFLTAPDIDKQFITEMNRLGFQEVEEKGKRKKRA